MCSLTATCEVTYMWQSRIENADQKLKSSKWGLKMTVKCVRDIASGPGTCARIAHHRVKEISFGLCSSTIARRTPEIEREEDAR